MHETAVYHTPEVGGRSWGARVDVRLRLDLTQGH